MATLGVNIDHVATVRQARRTVEPDPVWAAAAAELGGADAITVHLREDRRHIQDRDLEVLRRTVQVKLNLEAAIAPAMIDIACRVRPDQVTLVPERREEVTTEGGLDVVTHRTATAEAVRRLRDAGIAVSLFLDAEARQIDAAVALGADAVELHTGQYANATTDADRHAELVALSRGAAIIRQAKLALAAGHGLTYRNVVPVARLEGMGELNIGHSIVARAVFTGMTEAVREMKRLIGPA
jgi:pyridoxine 5-phosphate synthase